MHKNSTKNNNWQILVIKNTIFEILEVIYFNYFIYMLFSSLPEGVFIYIVELLDKNI